MHFVNPGPADPDLVAKMSRLEDEARVIGLYMQGFVLAAQDPAHEHDHDDGEPTGQIILTNFMVGSEAFSDRVLNPAAYEEDDAFRHITTETTEDGDPLEELRKKLAEGKGIFDSDDADD